MILKRFVPRSLRARLVLLTLGTIFLVQAGTMASISYFRNQFTETVTVEIVATTIRTLRAALAEIPADERAHFVQEASRNEWRLWSRTLPSGARLERRPQQLAQDRDQRTDQSQATERPRPRHDDLRRDLRKLVDALNLRLDDGTRVALSRGSTPRIYVSLQADEQSDADALATREWLVIPLDKLSPPVAMPLVAIWLAGMGIILLISAAFSWHITRPLTGLAKAADQLAAGKPQRVVPAGPSETRTLGERFNAMLDALNESDAVRRTLLAGLPHDLKGPLSRMWLRIEMIDEASLKDGLRHDLQDMQRMVDQFIGYVRGTDPATYRFTTLDLGAWLQEHVGTWESTGSDIRLMGPVQEGIVLHADGFALGRLLDNLITNSLRYGVPPIEISLSATATHAVMTISDHGPGISQERRTEALRPFSRLDDARTLTGAVGLGLALCNSIAIAHQGSLSLAEAESGGLEVTVHLPLLAQA